jgi:hypothetical protein
VTRPISTDEQPPKMKGWSVRRHRSVRRHTQPARDSNAATGLCEGAPSLANAIRAIAQSPLRCALFMAIAFQLGARTIASLRWETTCLDALTIEIQQNRGVQLLPLPLTVAAFLHEGDRPDALCADELEYGMHRFDAQWSLGELRRRIFGACAISDLRARSLCDVRTSVGFEAKQRSIARIDIGLLIHMDEPPTSLAVTSSTLKALTTVSEAGRRLLLLNLANLHAWAEPDVLTVARRAFVQTHEQLG